jgi:hypothetical protein
MQMQEFQLSLHKNNIPPNKKFRENIFNFFNYFIFYVCYNINVAWVNVLPFLFVLNPN